MSSANEPRRAPVDETHDMLEEPTLSRQWVLRRMQKTLTTDLAYDALLSALAPRVAGASGAALMEVAGATRTRVELVEAAIRHEGGTPYSSVGLARACSRIGGRLLAALGAWAWRPLLERLQEHVVAELDSLIAFVRDAPGVDPTLSERLAPMLPPAQHGLRALGDGPPAEPTDRGVS